MSEPYRRLPFKKETKYPTIETSKRNIKKRLLRLQEELDRVQDKLSYQHSKGSRVNIAGLIKKRNALQKKIANIEFPLLSKEEKKKRFTELEEAMKRLEILKEKKSRGANYEINRQYIDTSNEIREKRRNIPTEEWRAHITQKEKSERKNQERRLQETAKEAITSGIAQLKKTLEEIKRVQRKLPSVIVYPETTTRPISYAIEPLLKKIYVKHQQELPHRMFVKTFSGYQTDREWKLEKERKDRMTRIQNELRENRITIEEAKRAVKKHRPRTKEYDSESERLNQLKRKRKDLHDRLITERERINMFERGADHEAMNQRIRKIVSTAIDSPILVIDDLIGQGRTFRALEDAFKDAGFINNVYYFTFLSSPNPLEGLSIKKEQFSAGTVIKDTTGMVTSFPQEGEAEKTHPDFAYDRLVEDDTRRWQDLFFYGFPFRIKKEETTGVLKDQMDPSPYVVRSDKMDPSLMRRVRQQYRSWGEEAIKKIERSK